MGAEAAEEEEAEEAGYKIKHKNPTKRCGEKENQSFKREPQNFKKRGPIEICASVITDKWVSKISNLEANSPITGSKTQQRIKNSPITGPIIRH